MQTAKPKWIDKWGDKFELRSCKTAAEYIAHKTGIPLANIEVHKTSTYLVVTCVVNGQMRVEKLTLPGGVLYCLSEEDFEPLFAKLK